MTTSTWAFASWTLPAERQPNMLLLMSGSFVHKIIIAGCRRFASPLPSGPHQEGHYAERASARSFRRRQHLAPISVCGPPHGRVDRCRSVRDHAQRRLWEYELLATVSF